MPKSILGCGSKFPSQPISLMSPRKYSMVRLTPSFPHTYWHTFEQACTSQILTRTVKVGERRRVKREGERVYIYINS